MRTICKAPGHFILMLFDGTILGQLFYNESPANCIVKTEQALQMEHTGAGSWQSSIIGNNKNRVVSEIKIRPGGIILLCYYPTKRKYKLRSGGIYKNRFVLRNTRQEEILSLLPVINWTGRGHEYAIQVNEEFSNECSPLLILHAIHCANCYLGMLNGVLPALINI